MDVHTIHHFVHGTRQETAESLVQLSHVLSKLSEEARCLSEKLTFPYSTLSLKRGEAATVPGQDSLKGTSTGQGVVEMDVDGRMSNSDSVRKAKAGEKGRYGSDSLRASPMVHSSTDADMYGAGKTFDINTYRSRYIALEVLYIGWEYQGSTYQEGSQNSIEAGSTTAIIIFSACP